LKLKREILWKYKIVYSKMKNKTKRKQNNSTGKNDAYRSKMENIIREAKRSFFFSLFQNRKQSSMAWKRDEFIFFFFFLRSSHDSFFFVCVCSFGNIRWLLGVSGAASGPFRVDALLEHRGRRAFSRKSGVDFPPRRLCILF